MRAARWLGLVLLCLCRPAEPWYKPAAGPHHYSVGRASGLLSGLRHSPHARRSGTDGTAEPSSGVLPPGSARPPARLHAAVPCVTDVAPEPRSCRVLPGAPGALLCKADVTVSLDPLECAGA
ncbi:neuropeptide B [Grus americana]|uniref:Neuropeptide B n=2 Tax=Grus TaxID=9114 RepID=A0ABC9XJI5_GRUJA|nr:neuropeptide B [Grus americana]NWH25784.1 NPB protein [Grus americana]